MLIAAAKKVISYWVKFTQRHHYGDVSVDVIKINLPETGARGSVVG
jgi:hypothetical protein